MPTDRSRVDWRILHNLEEIYLYLINNSPHL
jgi:hypothetical protein